MAAASLVVRISADINDFTRQLNAMTKGVDRAAKSVSDVGRAMTIGVTLPVTLAGIALAKMGAENEAVGNKMDRSFGPAVQRMNGLLVELGKLVPETGTDLQKMAIQSQDFAKGLGMAAPKAELLTEQVLKLSADISAAKFISMGEALDVVQKALEGQTRGLKGVGIVIEAAQIKQEAYRLGLLKVGNELNPLGTALATYSLLVKQSGNLQGEAAKQHQDAQRQLQFLKRDLMEFADATSNLVVPALHVFARIGREVVAVLTEMPDWLKGAIMAFAAMIAVIGPTIIIMAKLTEAVTTLRVATTLLTEGSAIKKFVEILTNPEILIAMAAIALAVGGAMALWKKFHKEVATEPPKIEPLIDVKALMGGKTDFNTNNPLQEFQKGAGELKSAYEDAIKMGTSAIEPFAAIVSLNERAMHLYERQADKLGEMAQAARQVAIETKQLIDTRAVAGALFNGTGTTAAATNTLRNVTHNPATSAQIQLGLGSTAISNEVSLQTREAALRMKDTFDAVRNASVELGERFKQTGHDFATSISQFKQQWSGVGNIGTSAMAGLQVGVTSALASFGPMALAAMAIGKVMEGLQPILDKLMGPLVALGQIIGELAEPLLRPLFQSMKGLGIAVALVGEVIYTVAGGIAKAIGALISGLGRVISKIPFMGGLGHQVQDFGASISNLGNSALDTAKELDRSRIQLQNLDFDGAANGLGSLTDAANAAAEAMTNVPQAFKIALERYRATAPIDSTYMSPPAGLGGSGGPSGGGGGGGGGGVGGGGGTETSTGQSLNIVLDGRIIAQTTWDRLTSSAKRQFGSQDRVVDLVRVG